jgi:N-acetylmuramoyl-L-alanine amidase
MESVSRRTISGLICAAGLFALTAVAQEPYVRLVVPEHDTTHTRAGLYRLSAGTNPGNSATLNGKPIRVYSSGAMAGGLPLATGENVFTLEVRTPTGAGATRSFLVVRDSLPPVCPDYPVTIDSIMMKPVNESWLIAGDRLDVQCKGTPGCKATFLGGKPMIEVPPKEAGGVRGIYRGEYIVRQNDTLSAQPVTFVLQNDSGGTATASSRGTIAFRSNELPLCGITKEERPALAFGLGEDRLGGAKMSFLVPGIRLAVSGKAGRLYRVALAPGHDAWIDERAVELQPPGTRLPGGLTGTWNVQGREHYDEVTVALSDRLPYASSTESNPSRIVVEVFGATSNSNWIIQTLTAKEITDVAYSQPSTGVFRIEIALRHKQVWGYEIGYTQAGLRIRVRRQPERLAIKRLTFAVDAGHGGPGNLGALGSTGLEEKELNMQMARLLKGLLEDRGARVVMTRDSDESIPNNTRLDTVLSSDADILISLHANSIGDTDNPETVRGTSTFYKYPCYRPLSMFILDRILRTGIPLRSNVGSFNFTLNSPTELPNVLIELAYLSNPEDEIMLLDPDFRRDAAKKIVDGIDDFLDWCDD